MKKIIKYLLILLAIAVVGYKSVYFKKLSKVKKAATEKFDAAAFAKKLWDEKLPAKLDSAVDLSILIKEVAADKETGLKKYSNALAIGNYRYALIKTRAVVSEVKEDEIFLQLTLPDSVINAVLATEYIYGNAIRDASGLVDIKDFPNTTELNGISEGLNKIVRTALLPAFKSTVKKGDKIDITAAIELNKEHIKWSGLELIPLRLQIVQ